MTKTKKIILSCGIVVFSIGLIALLASRPVQTMLFYVDWGYRDYKADMKEKFDVSGNKEDLDTVKEYLVSLMYTVDNDEEWQEQSYPVCFIKDDDGKYYARLGYDKDATRYICTEEVYTALHNILDISSETSPLQGVYIRNNIVYFDPQEKSNYSLVYSSDGRPENKDSRYQYVRRAGDGWYHIWYS